MRVAGRAAIPRPRRLIKRETCAVAARNTGRSAHRTTSVAAAANPDAVLWIQNAETNGAIVAHPEKITEMARIPVIKGLTCVNKGHIYQAKSGSNWLPGSGLQKILPDLGKLRQELHP
jgi:hypothetical protein